MRPKRWSWRLLLVGFAASLVFPAKASAECGEVSGQLRDCSVLLVHSYHPGLEWSQILTENLSASLAQSAQVRIDIEYLDAKRRPLLGHASSFLQMLQDKYGSHLPDVLVISDDPAFDLLWPIHSELFPNVPVVFMGLNSVRSELTAQTGGVTGIFESHITEQTVELALQLTAAEGVVVLNDTSGTGKANEVKLEELVAARPDVTWVVERDLSVNDIDQIRALPDDWPIITMLPLREGGEGSPMLSQRQSVEFLRKFVPNPLFYDSEWMMGNGLVGGYTLSGSDHAAQTGELVLEVLGGSAPETIPVRYETRHQWIFDQRELDRFGWSIDRLPPNAEIQFTTEKFWQRHSQVLYPLLGALAAAALVILFLVATVSRQRRAEEQLLAQKQRLSAALAATHAGVFEIRPDTWYASPRWLALIDLEPSDTSVVPPEYWMENATTASRNVFEDALQRLANDSRRERFELTINGVRPRILDVLVICGADHLGREGALVGVATDVTATRQLEDEAARRNRLEMLGELAGGIAHDFNTFLLVVKFGTEMAKELDDPEEMRKIMLEIEEAGLRTTEIVKQLLAFGRHESPSGNVIDINQSVQDMLPFLQRLLGMTGDIAVTLHSDPLGVRLDVSQLERVLSNLVVNARDAMHGSGSIFLDVSLESVDSQDYAVVQVRDDGEGMDEATMERIFEPFYSTKAKGEGTGLGLSTVYGIVNSAGGRISVESQPGEGTVFKLFWPRELLSGQAIAGRPPELVNSIDKTILLVEDDPRVGPMTQKVLEQCGFNVILAKDGQEGLRVASEEVAELDLVLSDVVLPKMNGIEMVAEIRRFQPSIHVGFLSGFTDHPSLGGTELPNDVELLKKPFSHKQLQSFVERQFDDEKVIHVSRSPL